MPDTSMCHAMAMGGMEHLGWGMDRHLAASQYDAINSNTRATGQWKRGKAPNIKPWPRPKSKKQKKKKSDKKNAAPSVADFYRSLHGGVHKL